MRYARRSDEPPQTSVPNISMHLREAFAEGELEAVSVVKDSLTTAADGKNYATKFYNLGAKSTLSFTLLVRSPSVFAVRPRL